MLCLARVAAYLEIHFVDSSGVVSWDFLGEEPDHAFIDWNLTTTTQEGYEWLCACIGAEDKDTYIYDFGEVDVYACRILVPRMSEIYPVEDLQWKKNSVGNEIRAALNELDDNECLTLLDDLQSMDLRDERPLWEILGLAVPVETVWKELRIGGLKTLPALAIGDTEAAREGCD